MIKPSPKDQSQVQRGNALTVGSFAYNSAADLYAETCNPFLKFQDEDGKVVIRVVRGPREGEALGEQRGSHDDIAILEKVYDQATESVVFVAAGHDICGTQGAVDYLLDNWETLRRDFGTNPFAICLLFPGVKRYPESIHKSVEISRFYE